MAEKDNYFVHASDDSLQIVSFKVGEEDYGIPIRDIQRVIRLPNITHLPQTPDFLRGIINLEGEVVPIIDMHERFEMETEEYNKSTRVIIVRMKDKDVGMIVDSVSQVQVVAQENIEEVGDFISGISKNYIQGIAKVDEKMIILLKIEKILSTKEFSIISKARENNEKKTKQKDKKKNNSKKKGKKKSKKDKKAK